jgi:hypothetical protein
MAFTPVGNGRGSSTYLCRAPASNRGIGGGLVMKEDSRNALQKKLRFYEQFWCGEGPYPILFAQPHLAKGKAYLRHDLVEQHRSVEKHLEERLLEVQPHLDLIDDGIPTV